MRDQLIDTDQPRNRKQTRKRPKSKPLQHIHHVFRKVPNYFFRQRQRDHHDWKEDTSHECEEDHVTDREHADGPFVLAFGFLVDLDEAVEEGEEPEDPFEQSCKHECPNNGHVYDVSSRP